MAARERRRQRTAEETDSSRVAGLFWTAVVLIAAFTFVSPLVRMGDVPLGHLSGFQDDFFYYLAIARNLAETGSSTFDFIGHTNGYHPLWMGILTALAALVDAGSVWFFVLLQAIVFVLILITCHLFLRLAARGFPGAQGAHRIGALFLTFLYANLARTGMEVIVVVPAMLGTTLAVLRTIEAPSNSRVFGASVLCALTVLVRLDAAIFVLALVCAVALFVEPSQRRSLLRFLSRPQVLSLTLLGAAPLLGYLALNYTTFGSLMPQSGGAKQINDNVAFNPRVLEIFMALRPNLREQAYFLLMSTLPACLVIASTTLLVLRFRTLSRGARLLLASTNGFSFIYYGVLSVATDWALWIWYLYPVTVAGAFGVTSLVAGASRALPTVRVAGPVAQLATAMAFTVGTGAAVFTRDPDANTIQWAALRIATFAQTHPGVYVMGDRAGLAGFLLPRGLVQLEGLVSDPSLLELIRAEAPLDSAFQRFGVTYYVTTHLVQSGNCFAVEEPHADQAGIRSRKMRAALCNRPVAVWRDPSGRTIWIFQVGQTG